MDFYPLIGISSLLKKFAGLRPAPRTPPGLCPGPRRSPQGLPGVPP